MLERSSPGPALPLAFRKSKVVFFQNPDDRDLFVNRGIVGRSQSQLLPGSGVNLAHFCPRPHIVDGEVRFLFIGRLLGDKGVREFVDAARSLRPGQPNWRFQLLGPIDEENRSGISADELQAWQVDEELERSAGAFRLELSFLVDQDGVVGGGLFGPTHLGVGGA